MNESVDYGGRIRTLRERYQLTQVRLAELLGVSFASVNRWENGQNRPSKLAWEKIQRAEQFGLAAFGVAEPSVTTLSIAEYSPHLIDLDFTGRPEAVKALVDGERLHHGYLYNPAFATEVSRIDPLPHQRIAVYEHMLHQPRLRFLLADDAGAGKTIMAGLYIREMLARRLIRRVLIVPPAGLVGNWKRELKKLFNLDFRIISGSDARNTNPFAGPESDRIIVSVDTLSGERVFGRLAEVETAAYDLVVFDEAHKLSASRSPDYHIEKTERYKLAEAIAGIREEGERWYLPWQPHHLLLLTATPHMGKDFPYYCLWRLLEPDALSTQDAFDNYPATARVRHFIRRTKEEMVYFDGTPIYPTRISDTLSYELSPGEQRLYDETTDYIQFGYNRAQVLNRSAARLAMSVFQRRLASSTYALLRSFERRIERLAEMIQAIRSGKITTEDLQRQQLRLKVHDLFEELTADEEGEEGEEEANERAESETLKGVVALSLAELEAERQRVIELRNMAQAVYDAGEESKFEKLLEVLQDPAYKDEKILIFSEHRDTMMFLVQRLEGLGYTGRIAQISGGMPHEQRDEQVEFFRRPVDQGGAQYLIATDAAGEGINLQFCWLMVNYDVPWNPARLEQRMGRIHRYGQEHDPVIIINLAAGSTREGRVLQTLLRKLEKIRGELGSDKVFDVIGEVLEGKSIKQYLEEALGDEHEVQARLDRQVTKERVQEARDRDKRLYQTGDDNVEARLPELRRNMEEEQFRRLLPGYVRQFIRRAAPLLDLEVEGDLDRAFTLRAGQPGAMDALWPVLERYLPQTREQMTVYRPAFNEDCLWVHPGEPVFERLYALLQSKYGADGARGGVFVDPSAEQPYLLHIGLVNVVRQADPQQPDLSEADIRAERLIALRTEEHGNTTLAAPEQLLLLQGRHGFPPDVISLIARARALRDDAAVYARDQVAQQMVQEEQGKLNATLDERIVFLRRGFDYQEAVLAETRNNLRERFRSGEQAAQKLYERIKEQQRQLKSKREATLTAIRREPELIEPGEIRFIAHALVVPSGDPEDHKKSDRAVEEVAMQQVMAYERARGATPVDVSTPGRARSAGLPEWPGFDVLSRNPDGSKWGIEVKGRARVGEVELSENEWAKAINTREQYWLYVVYDCATAHPRLFRVQDPFGKLVAHAKGGVIIKAQDVFTNAA